MLKPRPGQARGMVVYVDNQLRHSRRFDAEGIERDHPELFVPFPRRRTSSTTSLSSMNSAQFVKENEFYLKKEEGQLRYWTSDMCSHSPHLFDFVVTVSGMICHLFFCFDDYTSSAVMGPSSSLPGCFNASSLPSSRLLSAPLAF